MAAVTELCFLLFALSNNIHAQELFIIEEEGRSHIFEPPNDSDSCLISRFVGEEKLVLWNTSDLWSQNSTLPEDLKQRLSVVRGEKTSSYVINNLTHSDISVIICSTVKNEWVYISVRLGETVDLPCWGASDNLDIKWLKPEVRYKKTTWTSVFRDNVTSVMVAN